MNFKLHSSDLQDFYVRAKYPDSISNAQDYVRERNFTFDASFGKGFFKEFVLGDISLGYGNLVIAENTLLFVESDMEIVKMNFVLNGETFGSDTYSGQKYHFACNQHNIIYVHGFRGNNEWIKSDNLMIFSVVLTPSFFEKYLIEHQDFQDFRDALSKNINTQISKYNQQVTPSMHLIIQDIIQTNRKGIYKRMFIEAKVIELFMLQLEQIAENHSTKVYTLKKNDVDRMHEVKEIISKNLSSTFSLVDLAREVGTNEFMLKKGFKEVFGTIVFGFWHRLKMQEAKNLLLSTELSISEISDEVGYKNPRHFSTAFKRHFGKSPSQLLGGKGYLE
ncbi:MAG: AraC family transcriptional regulator [Bacteroidota bacterium]